MSGRWHAKAIAMTELAGSIDPGLPLLLLLLALLGLRAPVKATARLFMRAPPDRVFALLDLIDGARQKWHRSDVSVRLIDQASRTYRIRYVSTLSSGTEQVSHADFRVVEREPPRRLVLERAGLEGRSHNNELLRIEAGLVPQGEGTRLTLTYRWGPRPLIAQLLARSDIYGGAYRLKGVAETGKPDDVTDNLISAGVALATGLVTLAGFGLWFGWLTAILLVVALLIHEFGHLLAFRMIGQPWGRLVFLPFLGALAMPRLPYERAAQSVFAALMGPGFSVVIPIAAALAVYNDAATGPWLVQLGIVSGVLNLFNLLPAEPLDGGVAMRSILGRLMGGAARFGMMALGLLLALGGLYLGQILLVVFGGIAVAANLRPRIMDHGLAPLNGWELALSFAGFAAVTLGHGIGLVYLLLHR